MKLRFWQRDDIDFSKPYFAPEDVQETSGAHSILLALITFVVTLGILFGLFFGGRAIYRHYNKDAGETASTETTSTTGEELNVATEPTPTPTPDTSGITGSQTLNEGVINPSGTSSTGTGTTQTSTSIVNTGSSEAQSSASDSLPNTGMSGPEELR